MVSQAACQHPVCDGPDGLSNFANLSVSAQAPGTAAFVVQRPGAQAANGNVTKSMGNRHVGANSSKNPFASMPREMRNNQLRNNLAAVAEQFKAMSQGQSGGASSTSSGSARTSGEFGNFNQQQSAPYPGGSGCQVMPQGLSRQGSLTSAAQPRGLNHTAAVSRSAFGNSPSNGFLTANAAAADRSPHFLPGMPTSPATYSPMAPGMQQHYLQQYSNNSTRSNSLDLQINSSSSDAIAFNPRPTSVDLTPYMVHQMQLQQQQQAGVYGPPQHVSAAAMQPSYMGSESLPQLYLPSAGSHSLGQQQQNQLLYSQPLLLGPHGGYSASDPTLYVPSTQRQAQMAMSASASLPPVTVALPVAQQCTAASANAQLQQLLYNQQVEQELQQRLLQLSGEY